MLRVGIVGCGNIFERGYRPVLPKVKEVRIGSVCDLVPERAASAREAVGAAKTATDARELFEQPDLDAVFILTPTHTHADLAVAALGAGKDVLCEKPMARTLADAKRMTQAAEKAGKRLMIGHTRRFDDRWNAILEPLRAGRLGELTYLFRSEHGYNGAPASAWPWADAKSGGVQWDVGIHIAELFQWFFERPARRVYARRLNVRPESREGGAPDAAVVQFDFGDHKHAVFSVSWIHPPSWAPFYASMDLIGTGGKLSYTDRDMHGLCLAAETIQYPRYSPLLSSIATAFEKEIRHFAVAVEGGGPFRIGLPDAQSAVGALEAADQSARSGGIVEVPR